MCRQLSAQAAQLDEEVEILCIDDDSSPSFKHENQKVAQFAQVQYEELAQNIGRSRIRNLLLSKAQYDIIIFLDNDSEIVRSDFISKYLANVKNGQVICGGTLYPKITEKAFRLHCNYGIKRESPPFILRNENPYKHFKSNNFCINKKDFKSGLFDEGIQGYGYEDNQFSELIKKQGMEILHIDNPVIHLGLMNNEEFVNRQLSALENLYDIKCSGSTIDSNLWNTYAKLNFPIMKQGTVVFLNLLKGYLKNRLIRNAGPLLYLDLLKLERLFQISRKKTKR